MNTPRHVPLTPEQLAAVSAGSGFAECEDPTTHTQYHLIKVETPTLSDDYLRQKVQEAYADGEATIAPLDMKSIKAQLANRRDSKQ